ncbi:MAG: hypothetical protein O7G85_15280 [Planctomycetota bacterium]|nr:hypothetical protein [Planctomycetota bacterium]
MSTSMISRNLRKAFHGDEVIEPSQKAIIVAVLLGVMVGATWNGVSASSDQVAMGNADNQVAMAKLSD